ncbi:3-mercaptopyruvate sulfurtransferase [Hyphomicrobium sp.]|uniref:3-mercaptopyruvate sulfurtransferase n=1 Tax=Hyphomicrobium sp. TaxID=82 RepID=UPI002FDD78BB
MVERTKTWIVETQWLADHLDMPDLVIFDGSWHLPGSGRDAKAEYLAEHIPGALFFDIDDLVDETSPLPHMLPPTAKFASRMKKIGVGDGMRIVIYDTLGLFSAARVWWTFRAMGHQDVAVLNGGLKKWKAEGRPLEDGSPVPRTARHFTPLLNNELVCDLDEMRGYVESGRVQIVDARPKVRFEGSQPEPRPGLRAGHIPGSKNVPASTILNADGTLKDKDELGRIFRDAGIDPQKPVVASCGSGVTASMLALALGVLGQRNVPVYDGSWAEWGQETAGTPIETGPASRE